MMSRFDSIRRIAGVVRGVAKDRISPTRPLTLDEVPASASAITAEWATLALCGDSGVRVTDVRHEQVSNGSSGRSRLHLSYTPTDAATTAQLPPTVFVKHAPRLGNRMQVGITGALWSETRFYRDVRPNLPELRSPVGYFGKSDRRTGRAVLLIEDMSRTRPGVRYGDILEVQTDRAMAESLIDNLAILHGTFLDSDRLTGEFRWMLTSLDLQTHLNAAVDIERRTVIGFDRAAAVIPAALEGRRNEVQAALMKSLSLDARGGVGLVHTDVHAGNWFIEADGSMGLYDWAAVARGLGTRDVAYALMSNLRIEDRRAWERDLLDRYTQRLSEVSGRVQDREHVWASYRQQTLHGLCYWLYTLGRGPLQPQMQSDTVSLLNIERMAQAVVDLETFPALDRV